MVRYRWAAVLMIIHGGLMELGPFVALVPVLASGLKTDQIGRYFHFIVPYFQDNLFLMMAMSGIFGAVRIVGAIGVLRNRPWGLALSIIKCVVTMMLMIFVLPAGLADGVLACTALVLMLTAYFGKRPIEDSSPPTTLELPWSLKGPLPVPMRFTAAATTTRTQGQRVGPFCRLKG